MSIPATKGNGAISPFDAVSVINYINTFIAQPEKLAAPLAPTPYTYLDVTGDGIIVPLDAVLIINKLNAPSPPAGAEGESVALTALA